MRQLLIQVPRGQGDKVLDMAKAHQGTNLARFEASDTEGKLDFVITYWTLDKRKRVRPQC
ncbi:hypothetical protein MC7420_2405 [Coleofasciculus chthonoplastes PCC 7420]|uniref:ACT domain-containing protein n=1 Tax=Coleofasciculus chthonoplastes PCC 7420 TaxID=118168 RepID=B4W248_9CYAN|nr:hypothetical protein [Coleofasciculus chthonoplastes]EDX71739.1 hypothetical protein MC7420_2405 [Coleofasciculus chthonoplastes PCC 7420]